MSGGFFRGTSADQDTRFSNKQAKLMKSQKFASELEHLVDVTKVKMDVMRPWIATRVTELLGFEDEVLINFIYGLLDGKEVNGKEIQISLTGFMEKNTGKFMKELWTLLLSAQKNASGVPQQFIDAKEEEIAKKDAERERITSEIQKKKEKEGREMELEKMRKLDGEADIRRANNANLEPSSKHHPGSSIVYSPDENETSARNGLRGRNRVSKSPSPSDVSLSPRNRRSRSTSKSLSNSRSYSEERRKSIGLSRTPPSRGRSGSPERAYRSRPRRSITPPRKYSPPQSLSPPLRRSSHSRRRSTSRSNRISPSPVRRRMRSSLMYRSRSPTRRRSRTPVRRRSRSPQRYRSRSPLRRRYPTPLRRRSRTPVRRRSPSPVRRRYRRSPSSPLRRSPSSPLRRSPSPFRRRSPIPSLRRSPTSSRRRPPSPEQWSSPSPVRCMSPSPVRKRLSKRQKSPVRSPRERTRMFEKFSPVRNDRHSDSVENSDDVRKGPGSVVHRPSISLRSPQRDPRVLGNSHRRAQSSSPSPYHSDSRPGSRRSGSEDRRSYGSPVKQSKEHKIPDISTSPPQKPRDQKPSHDSPGTLAKEAALNRARDNGVQKLEPSERRSAYSSKPDVHKDVVRAEDKDDYSPERSGGQRYSEIRKRSDGLRLRKKELEMKSEKISRKVLHPDDSDKEKVATVCKDSHLSKRQRESYPEGAHQADEKIRSHLDDKRLYETETALKTAVKSDDKDGSGSLSSESEDSDKRRLKVHEKRKHRRSGRKEVASDDSYDSEIEDRKEAKRRKKEEKRLRKEERRRRREERRRRREERRAEKLKSKSNDRVTPPSDHVKNHDGSDGEEAVSEQKKLEIELRKKALESLRAKKGVGH